MTSGDEVSRSGMSRRRLLGVGLGALGAAGVMQACGGGSSSRSDQAESDEGAADTGIAATTAGSGSAAPSGPFKLGWVLPTTGQLASSFGPLYIAAQMAMDEINAAGGILGQQIEKVVEDDEANPAKQPAVFRKLSEQGVSFVAGPTGTSASLAAVPVSTDLQIMTSSNANATALGDATQYPFNFQLTYTIEQMAEVCARNAIGQLGGTSIGILAEDTAFGEEHTAVATRILESEGISVTEVQNYALDVPDMSTYLRNLQSAGVDLILAWQTSVPNMTAALKGLNDMSWSPTFVGSSLGIAVGPVMEAAGPDLAESIYTIQLTSWTRPADGGPLAAKQRAHFDNVVAQEGAEGRELGIASQSLYDFVNLVAATANEIGTDDVVAVRDAMQTTQGWEGMSGTFAFTPESHSGLEMSSVTLGSLGSISEPESDGFFMRRIAS